MKTPQWLVDFYRKWWAAVTPPDPNAPGPNPYVGEEIPRYMTPAKLHAYWEDSVRNPWGPGTGPEAEVQQALHGALRSSVKVVAKGRMKAKQPIKARKALKKAKKRR